MHNHSVKFSCLPVSLYQKFTSGLLDIPAWSVIASEMGLDSIDINAMFFKDLTLEQLVAVRKNLKLPVLMVSAYSDFTNENEQMRMQAVNDALRHIESAGAIGASYIRLTAGQCYPDMDEARTIENIYDCFEKCVPTAERNGITIIIENHSKPGAWQYPDFDFCIDRFSHLWDRLKMLPVGVNFDVANAFALEDWKTIYEKVSDRIETVHINDLASIDPLTFCCVGEGIVPIKDMMCLLIKDGYKGPLCIEEASFRDTEGILCAFKNTRNLWAEAIAATNLTGSKQV